MGIVNITPDSFSDGGKFLSPDKAADHAFRLLDDGVHWLDLGAESSRPGSEAISENEELDRLMPVLEQILKHRPETVVSVDTCKSVVAKTAIAGGCSLINDISAGDFDKKMIPLVAELGSSMILMHMQGTPKSMQDNPQYKNVSADVRHYLANKLTIASLSGIDQVLLDPGFGFGKTLQHNYELLKSLPEMKRFNVPIVVGISRKSMVGQLTGKPASDRLLGSKVAETVAFLNGANVFRVHDAAETKDMLEILNFYRSVQL